MASDYHIYRFSLLKDTEFQGGKVNIEDVVSMRKLFTSLTRKAQWVMGQKKVGDSLLHLCPLVYLPSLLLACSDEYLQEANYM